MINNNVFIATMPRSGSTLLGMVLEQHPLIYHAGETFFWGRLDINTTRCSCGNMPCQTLSRVKGNIKFEEELNILFKTCSMFSRPSDQKDVYANLSIQDFNEQYDQNEWSKLENYLNISCEVLGKMSNIFREIVAKKIIIDNTKVIQIGQRLLNCHDWKVILLTRDVRGVASSNKNLALRKNREIMLESRFPYYIQFARHAINLLKTRHKNLMWVKYEDVCHNPKKIFSDICNFIGIEYSDEMLNFRKNKGHAIMGNRMRFEDNDKFTEDLSWESRLSLEEKQIICNNKELVKLYKILGYNLGGM